MRQLAKYLGVAIVAAYITAAGMWTRGMWREWNAMRTEILAARVLLVGDASKSLAGEVMRQREAKAEQKRKLDEAKAKAASVPSPAPAP